MVNFGFILVLSQAVDARCELRVIILTMLRRRIKGATLATTLIFASLALVLGLAISSASITQLHFAQGQTKSWKAQAAAEAAIALATERLYKNPDFGLSDSDESVEVKTTDGIGMLSFDRSQARAWGIPLSRNLKEKSTATNSWREALIPPHGIHLVAMGESGGFRKYVDVVLLVPDFPFALASSGPIVSQGGFLVGAVDNAEEAFAELKAEDLSPADLVSNASGEAILVGGSASISGNVKGVGSISLGDEVVVFGEVEENAEKTEIAKINVSDLSPDFSEPLDSTVSPVINTSLHYNQPDLVITGGLEFNDGVLFVNGDVEIHGGIRGHGALLVNGKIEIHDGAALAAEDQIAMVAQDDVTVHGSDSNSSFFQGLIYTEGDLFAEDITLLGAFVANGDGSGLDPGSRLELRDTRVISLPEFSSFKIEKQELNFGITVNGVVAVYYFAAMDLDTLKALDIHMKAKATADPIAWNSTLHELMGPVDFRTENPNGDPVGNSTSAKSQGIAYLANHALFGPDFLGSHIPTFERNEGRRMRTVFSFDLNEFLGPEERTRVLSWREH